MSPSDEILITSIYGSAGNDKSHVLMHVTEHRGQLRLFVDRERLPAKLAIILRDVETMLRADEVERRRREAYAS